ncbi:trypsin-like peptidase domain-containing protein [Nonomuraea sp. bgisy101]|uniref:trypsin-like peptidase domain-containing protein n=1 Tax=Nonomuraea sp. bgisy101 TaxID=3413784 RepID=UPI003D744786
MMRWLWLPILLVLVGCSTTMPSPAVPIHSRTPPSGAAVPSKTVSARQSVVRLSGLAPSCDKKFEGSGFVYAPQRVVTAAHVVAGVTESLSVTSDDGEVYPARVVTFDPDVDVAVLYVAGLPAPSLLIAGAPPGDAHVLGYPKGAKRAMVQPIKIEQEAEGVGPDIYGKREVTKSVLSFSADVRPGLSGAPLVVPGGTVAGMVIASATDRSNLGYALTAEELLSITKDASDATRRVSTRQCDGDG